MLYPFSTIWGGGNEKQVYIYNSNSQCERIEYYKKYEKEKWLKSEYYTLCFWTNDNMTMSKHFKGDNLEFTETYQYDNRDCSKKCVKVLNFRNNQ